MILSYTAQNIRDRKNNLKSTPRKQKVGGKCFDGGQPSTIEDFILLACKREWKKCLKQIKSQGYKERWVNGIDFHSSHGSFELQISIQVVSMELNIQASTFHYFSYLEIYNISYLEKIFLHGSGQAIVPNSDTTILLASIFFL